VPAVLLVAVALVATFVVPHDVAAVPPTVAVPSGVKVARDYFSAAWSDPMDFSNAEDLDTTANGPMIAGGSAGMANGELSVSAEYLYLLRSIGNVLPTSATRDSDAQPMSAQMYRYLSLRMYAPTAGTSAIEYQTCDVQTITCRGVKYFWRKAGWHTYILDMAADADVDGRSREPWSVPWTGTIKNLLMVPDVGQPAGLNIRLDWVRLTGESTLSRLNLSGGSGGNVQLAYDVGGDPNTATTIGVPVSPSGAVDVRLGALPGGSLRFFTIQGGSSSARSVPVRLDDPPAPMVIDPDEVGGDDWATVVRRDPWDFEQLSDVWQTHNMNFLVGGGWGNGWSGPPSPNDPLMLMNNSGQLIDARQYHRASVRIRYEGRWGLESAGGGMVGRFVWATTATDSPQVSQDFLLTTQPRTYTVDLTTWPPAAVLDGGGAGNPQPVGWGHTGSEAVRWFRFDPHEDESPRGWHIDEIRLTRNDRVAPVFDIRFADSAWESGTTATLWADTDRNPFNGRGVPIRSGVPVSAGINTLRWDGAFAVPQSYWVYVEMTDPAGTTSGAYATGQLDVVGPPQTAPVGTLDLVESPSPGTVRVAGWSFDPDNTAPVDVHLYGAGGPRNLGPARRLRYDLLPFGYGPEHGYDETFGGVPAGTHQVCAHAINNGPGAHTQLGCRSVVVK
jgi:hypothetical protein